MKLPTISLLVLTMVLSACGSRNKDVVLTKIRNDGPGPDEFAIVPGKPLQEPANYTTLPQPTPGGSNITDQNPLADGIVALGGSPTTGSGISAADGALVNHSRRFGVNVGIRQTLRQEDVNIRRSHGRVNILRIGPDDYNSAYRRQWLDSKQETARLRSLGIPTSSSPPIVPGRRR
ncbi:DUF3035 domain-containing protein [Roseovarius phycicola]|uniref:DUF3035 domain-containing protein n=1 Tax=Roseovarius phycicola TaxID=3080976 RepID=A0ABZ2HFQ8_9RHOB